VTTWEGLTEISCHFSFKDKTDHCWYEAVDIQENHRMTNYQWLIRHKAYQIKYCFKNMISMSDS
jgi:hypothetical protein